MRFILMHKTNAHWEAGAVPGPELIGRVGRLMGELASASVLLGAEGLRATSQGVRLSFSQGKRTVTHGPFEGENELPAGFDIVSVGSIDEAIEWATRQAEVLGDIDVDIRPVTEAWDIGLAPKPEGLRTRRYMVLRKASAASEAGLEPSPAQRAQLTRITEEARQRGVHLASESMRPSGRGRRSRIR